MKKNNINCSDEIEFGNEVFDKYILDKVKESNDLSNSNKLDLNSHKNDTNNPHKVSKLQLGLENVDNTSDINKPVSLATQIELSKKANIDYIDDKLINKQDLLSSEQLININNVPNKVDKDFQATETQLGLVKASPRINEVEEVRLDTKTGKLYSKKVPTKTSELSNDKGYITSADGGNALKLEGSSKNQIIEEARNGLQPIGNYATKDELTTGLNGKQPIGDYVTNDLFNEGLLGKQDKGDYATNPQLTAGLETKQDKLSPKQIGDINNIPNKANSIDLEITNNKVNSIDTKVSDIDSKVTNIENGTTIVEKAKRDSAGNVINETYATKAVVKGVSDKVTNIENGTTVVPKATHSVNSDKATDSDKFGGQLPSHYATKKDVTESMKVVKDCKDEVGITGYKGCSEGLAFESAKSVYELPMINGQTGRASLNELNLKNGIYPLTPNKESSVEIKDGVLIANVINGKSNDLINWLWKGELDYIKGQDYTLVLNDIKVLEGNLENINCLLYVEWYSKGLYNNATVSKDIKIANFNIPKDATKLLFRFLNTGNNKNYKVELKVQLLKGTYNLSNIPAWKPHNDNLVNSHCVVKTTGVNLMSDKVYDWNNWKTFDETNLTKRQFIIGKLPEGNYNITINTKTALKGEYVYLYESLDNGANWTLIQYLLADTRNNTPYMFKTKNNAIYRLWANAKTSFDVIDTIMLNYGGKPIPYTPHTEDVIADIGELAWNDSIDNVSKKKYLGTSKIINGRDLVYEKAETYKGFSKYRALLDKKGKPTYTKVKDNNSLKYLVDASFEVGNHYYLATEGDYTRVYLFLEETIVPQEYFSTHNFEFSYELATITEIDMSNNPLPFTMRIEKGGMELQQPFGNALPYNLTKIYSVNKAAQIDSNSSANARQNDEISALESRASSLETTTTSLENNKADTTYVDEELGKKVDKTKQATETELGLVKAKQTTEEDTQEVNIGEDGKLYTKSCFYNPNKVSLFGFTPDAQNNTFTLIGSVENPLDVDWGDGSNEIVTKYVTHTYVEPYKDIMLVVKGKIRNYSVFNKNLDYINLGENELTIGSRLLANFKKLKIIKFLNINKVTSMTETLAYCPSLISIPIMDTSKVTSMTESFRFDSLLTTIPPLNTKNVIDMHGMFDGCTSLTSIPQLNTSEVTDMQYMFNNCNNLTSIPLINTSKVTSMNNMFSRCESLLTVPQLNTSNVTDMTSMFYNCINIEEINMININANLGISNCQKMQQPALHKVIDNLMQQEPNVTKTLTLGTTLLSRVSEEYKIKATDKGWTLA